MVCTKIFRRCTGYREIICPTGKARLAPYMVQCRFMKGRCVNTNAVQNPASYDIEYIIMGYVGATFFGLDRKYNFNPREPCILVFVALLSAVIY